MMPKRFRELDTCFSSDSSSIKVIKLSAARLGAHRSRVCLHVVFLQVMTQQEEQRNRHCADDNNNNPLWPFRPTGESCSGELFRRQVVVWQARIFKIDCLSIYSQHFRSPFGQIKSGSALTWTWPSASAGLLAKSDPIARLVYLIRLA